MSNLHVDLKGFVITGTRIGNPSSLMWTWFSRTVKDSMKMIQKLDRPAIVCRFFLTNVGLSCRSKNSNMDFLIRHIIILLQCPRPSPHLWHSEKAKIRQHRCPMWNKTLNGLTTSSAILFIYQCALILGLIVVMEYCFGEIDSPCCKVLVRLFY